MNKLLQYNKYFFLFAHPDDEVYCSILISQLINLNKKIVLAYATSGDNGGSSAKREKEVLKAVKKIRVNKNNVYFFKIPEKKLLDRLHQAINLSLKVVKKFKPDCIIGQDYEGGHEGHDAVSFCASEIARLEKVNNHFVFPIYYGKPGERKGARFKPQRKKYLTLKLTKKERKLKKDILRTHSSQKNHFDGLQKSSSDYYDLLFSREVYFKINRRINFYKKPMKEIGYEFHRNGYKYSDFKNAIKKAI